MQNQLDLSAQTQPSNAPSKASATSPKAVWNAQLSKLLRQSFDIFNTFGKDPDALENILPGFAVALDGCDMRDISSAFQQWLREKEKFPTPAEIKKLAENYRTLRLQRLGANIPKSWTQVIRSKATGEVLAEFAVPRDQLAPIDLDARFGSDWQQAFRRD